jgi:hypothetical protein
MPTGILMNSRLALILVMAALAAGCATNAPTYQPVIANVEAASKLRGPVAVGKFDFTKGQEASLNSVTARTQSLNSPVNGSFADYLAEAAKSELKAAGKFDAASPKVLTGTIEKNSLSGAGIFTNDAEVSVRFTLTDGAKPGFEKTLAVRHEWDSSFLGAIAIPRAFQNYVVAWQMLLYKLYIDPDFVDATGRK